MQINKVTVTWDPAEDPDAARVHIYTDNAPDHTVIFVRLAPDWEIVKVWATDLYDFFQTADGRQLALSVCLPMEEIRKITKHRVEYTIRKDDPILDDLRVYMEAQSVF
ncbi:MAG: hypothetical protein J5758_01435 [Abditibacteriota bacterium]|nr:hypothetical protein [Abditibacteriota bacterium]